MYYFYDLKLDLPITAKPNKVKEFLLTDLNAIFADCVRHGVFLLCVERPLTSEVKTTYDFVQSFSLVHRSEFLTEMATIRKGI